MGTEIKFGDKFKVVSGANHCFHVGEIVCYLRDASDNKAVFGIPNDDLTQILKWEQVERFTDPGDPQPEDEVNSPSHYTHGGIECIDSIQASMSKEEFEGYCKGNAQKYLWRWRHKGGRQSLEKAAWYLNKLLEISNENDQD